MASAYPTRSNSFPSRRHPFASQVDEHLSRLSSSQATSSSSSIGESLNGLQDLYDCVDKLLQSSLTQQSLAQEKNKKIAHDLLDGSLVLLDMCNIAKDSLLQIKESTIELQSILRRRRVGEFELVPIKKYLNSRKVVKKAIQKALRNFKVKESCDVDVDHETKSMVRMLREVESMTFSVFKSFLSLISGPRSQSKLSAWSSISKLIQSKIVTCDQEEDGDMNEFEKVDIVLSAFVGNKKIESENIIPLQNQLKELEICIQDLEEGIECLSRRLIKSRVYLLNILTN